MNEMTPRIEIVRPGIAPANEIAHWLETEWPGIPIIKWLRIPLNDLVGLPIVLAAFLQGSEVPCGCGALLNDDLTSRPDLNPWLGCVYVEPSARRRNIARCIVRALLQRAAHLHIPILYLFCEPALREFYASEGWTEFDKMTENNKPIILMKKRIL